MGKQKPKSRAASAILTAGARETATVIAFSIFLVALVFAVFWPTLGAQFVNYDDNDYVYENPNITGGLTFSGIRWAFTHFHAANWHPLTTISHMLDCQMFGLQPWGHHLANIILHALAAVLLFLALRKLTLSTWPSGFAAALFAIHPLRVESVAWIAERKDVLSGVFFMLTLLAYANYARSEQRSIARYLLVVLFFALGLMCKPTLVTVPFVLLLLDYWPLGRMLRAKSEARSGKRQAQKLASQGFRFSVFGLLVVEKLPLFAFSAISSAITVLAQRGGLAENVDLRFSERVMNALIAYVIYIRQTVFPSGLAVVYPYPQGQMNFSIAFLAGLFLFAVTLIFFSQRRKRPFLIVGWLWFLGMLVPMIGIVQVGSQPHADRYTYLGQIGLFCLLSWLAFQLANPLKYRTACFAVTLIVIAALASRSYAQCRYWNNSGTLWEHAIAVTDGNYIAYNNFGDVLMDKGQLDDAIKYYKMAVELRPSYTQAQSNLGNLLLRKGQTDEALSHLEKAQKFAEGLNNLASGYMQKGRIEEAITYYQRAIEVDPNYAEAHNNLGVALLQNRRIDDAIVQYRKAVEIKPDSAELQCNLGNALANKPDWPGAIEAYESALRTRPNYGKARNNLGVAFEQLGKRDEAFAQFERNVQDNPTYAEAQCNFGRVLAQRGRTEEAVAHLNEALRLQPGYDEAKKQLNQIAAGR